jgi:hypothetical protein
MRATLSENELEPCLHMAESSGFFLLESYTSSLLVYL